MPFLLYNLNTLDSRRGEYELNENLAAHVMGRGLSLGPEKRPRPGEISLAGRKSPFRIALADAGSTEWHATDEHLLFLLGVERPEEHRIVIDLKPRAKTTVSLYRLRDVWACSAENWTPLMFRLESLLVDAPQEDPDTFKKQFTEPQEARDFIYEFLYQMGGTQSGNWVWGKVGYVNGALLWPDALRYFFGAINRQFIKDELEPLCP